MVSTDRLLAFAAMSLLVIAIPGPSVLFVIGRALAHGRRTALATVLGNVLGSYLLVAAVALGLGALVEQSAAVFLAVKLAGAAYLVFLGVQAFRHRKEMKMGTAEVPAQPARGDLRTIADGALVGVTNPKGIVFFAAVLPQFVDRAAGGLPAQMLVLGLVPISIGLITDTVWGLTASAARAWFARSERRLSLIGGAGGFAMIGLGVTVAATGRAD
ncbi:Threonine/homoserine/homoserine lactone efflux protein [Streptomyces sp. 2224.1]|uniref:LysE family translocator n=1 Tax=unclassified Streptomyces TaxID=2593676 RepID=UPI00087E0499|nr:MULTISPECIES: LysE family translocator [unclassified Streptomyces]PBC86980.1 threonine/homoserine/homoserine lactone efflux protein [Streptomyces sp. 2321.6]SDQ65725.1 Threonine/homoserine/homoserine lactone efflux protein [Streptomyces sp. KS_16]SED33386.1 Threonine/homoserine/homoserine lactone efflux protein [Streptomyces sp. 2112.3]SED76119.1 Threonine/homoserine/homoserine lactone efflux protein [Streptomyces sp. 2224.1]SEE15531.1 Threonine/homoserine/homoserine lactone efflux protein 